MKVFGRSMGTQNFFPHGFVLELASESEVKTHEHTQHLINHSCAAVRWSRVASLSRPEESAYARLNVRLVRREQHKFAWPTNAPICTS